MGGFIITSFLAFLKFLPENFIIIIRKKNEFSLICTIVPYKQLLLFCKLSK